MIKGLLAFATIGTMVMLGSCSNYQPRPRGYFRIELPNKTYTQFENKRFPFTFDMPDTTLCNVIEKRERKEDMYGFNIAYPKLRGCLYCDYKPVSKDNFWEISEDFRSFVYKHDVKADEITEQLYVNDEAKVYGLLYEIQGNTASQIQFVLTDSCKHYFRGAYYFNVSPNADSLAPVTKYVKEDILRIIESFKWKN